MKLLFFTREKVSVDNGKILLDDAMLTMSLLNWLNKREHKSTLNRLSKFLEKNIVWHKVENLPSFLVCSISKIKLFSLYRKRMGKKEYVRIIGEKLQWVINIIHYVGNGIRN